MPTGRYIDLEKVRLKGTLYLVDRSGSIINRITGQRLIVETIDNIDYVDLGGAFIFKNNKGNLVRVIDLVGFGFKPVNLGDAELKSIECLPIDGGFDNIELDNLVWKFPIGGLESIKYPGWFYIPGFTNYLVQWTKDRQLDLLSTKILAKKDWHRDQADYLATSLACDTGQRIGISIQRIIGLTFLDYPLNAKDLVVDHIDQVRRNNDLENFQWLGLRSNLVKGLLYQDTVNDESIIRLNSKIRCMDFLKNEIREFNSVRDVLSSLDIRDWQVRQSLESYNENRQGVVKGRYIFRLEGQKFPTMDEESIKRYLSYGGQPRPTLLKDIVTNTIIEYESAAALIREMKFSKKAVTTRLKNGVQQIPDTQYLVKYKDDPSNWII